MPLLRLRYVGPYSDAELLKFLADLDRVLELPGRKVCVIDLSAASPGSAKQRRLQGEWIKEHERLLARDFAAAVIVTDSAVIRGTVTAVFWIRPLPLPTRVAATVAEAEQWLAPYMTKPPPSQR